MDYQEHIERVKENFIKRGGYSSEKKSVFTNISCFVVDFRRFDGIVNLFNFLNVNFPLETELSQENIFEENWDSLDDSVGGGMISEAEKGDVCYILIGFEEFSDKYPDAWEFLSILYKSAGYIKMNNLSVGNVEIHVFR